MVYLENICSQNTVEINVIGCKLVLLVQLDAELNFAYIKCLHHLYGENTAKSAAFYPYWKQLAKTNTFSPEQQTLSLTICYSSSSFLNL
jgi:uncharacterized protein YecT (DUF1311 family)